MSLVLLPFLMGLSACENGGTPGVQTSDDGQVNDVSQTDLPAGDESSDESRPDTTEQDLGPIPDGLMCRPRETDCLGSNFSQCKDDGSDWVITPCTDGAVCTPDGCKKEGTPCVANEASCDAQGRVVVCLPDGSALSQPVACAEGYVCKAGKCVAGICTPGQTDCTTTSLLTCTGNPPAWTETPCGENRICFKDACIECFTNDQCQVPMACVNGACVVLPLEILTDDLPDGVVDVAYSATMEAQGGIPPYVWSVTTGALPAGLAIDAASGAITGKPTAGGTTTLTITVTDDGGLTAAKELSIRIRADSNLAITSKSPLPNGEEGTPYTFQFAAIGGTKPYGWMVTSGGLPKGLSLASDGLLSGTPEAHGNFEFSVRVVDIGDPIGADTKSFTMTLKIAPLEFIGDTVVNLFLTKAVILKLITVVEGIPLPYSTPLQAKGGVKPYHWAEQQLPGFLKTFIPKAGIPKNLTLADDGTLSGSVTDTSLVFELKVPILNYTLTGFFFMAQVTDSQEPPASASAIFLIPTIPVNLGGGLGL